MGKVLPWQPRVKILDYFLCFEFHNSEILRKSIGLREDYTYNTPIVPRNRLEAACGNQGN